MRSQDWPERLARYVAERKRTAFAWGVHDCCRFTCLGLVAQGLADPMPARLRRYRTARGARLAILRLGADLDAAATVLAAGAGLDEIGVRFAGRGFPVLADVVCADGGIEPALGLCMGRVATFVHPVSGLVDLPLPACRRAWRVA